MRARPAAAVLAAGGLIALATRTPGIGALAVVTVVGLVGLLASVPKRSRAPAAQWPLVVALGLSAFAFVAFRFPLLPLSLTALSVGASVLAAIAEEAFFRRFLYGWLAEAGALLAVVLAAAAFAAVHVPIYGLGSLPLNLAAGLVFGWQRWASGSWTAPAATHAAANVLAYL